MKVELPHLGWRLLLAVSFCLLAQAQKVQACCEVDDSTSAAGAARILQQAILTRNVPLLLRYIDSDGVVSLDGEFTRKEMKNGLSDTNSGIWKYLYGQKGSIRAFFQEDGQIKIVARKGGKNLWLIDFHSPKRGLSVSCQIAKIGRRWKLVSLFSFV